MLAIRLTRRGAKKAPFYRVVVTEKEHKRDGRFVEVLGYYDPVKEPALVKLNQDRINYWIERGAQPTDSVRKLIKGYKEETPVAEPAASA